MRTQVHNCGEKPHEGNHLEELFGSGFSSRDPQCDVYFTIGKRSQLALIAPQPTTVLETEHETPGTQTS